ILFFSLHIPTHPRSTLFSYTTLFRSLSELPDNRQAPALENQRTSRLLFRRTQRAYQSAGPAVEGERFNSVLSPTLVNRKTELNRSEEHTSELQSPCNLVCRLLLEKKK